MSVDDDRSRVPQFLDIDSFDIDMASAYDQDLDPFDDGFGFDCSLPSGSSPLDPNPDAVTVPEDPQVGRPHDSDLSVAARRRAQYRSYPVHASTIHRHLRNVHGMVTKEMLQSLIAALRRGCTPSTRPPPPTRDQLRAKGGLVAWLDNHESMALAYLRSQNRPA
jgi:hypothetical protein